MFRGGRSFHSNSGPSWRGRGNNTRFLQHMKHANRSKNPPYTHNPPGRRLTEEEIGVNQYISDHQGFSAIIKNRFSDFQVSEINEAGEVAKLTCIKPPVQEKEVIDEDEEFLLSKYNLELLPMETWDQINTLAVKDTTNVVEIDVTGMSKEHRTKIHEAVKKAFGEAVVGSTVTKEDKKFVKFEKYRVGVRIDKRVKWMWPGEYVHFILYKENCDTIEAATLIAAKLNIFYVKPSMIGYAGTKDRRAKTTQWFSIRKIDPSKIANACFDLRDVRTGNYTFANTPIKLGCLKGNRFRIALRNVMAEDDVVNKACEHLRDKGFINYYGLQRFGTRQSTPTYSVGLHLLQGHFKEAINAILEVREGPLHEALVIYNESGDAEAACRRLRKCDFNTIEGRILNALSSAPNDLYGAMSGIARNVRLLYLHSYQSLIWNRVVSERLRRFTYKPVPGDIVLEDENDYQPENEEDQEGSDNEDAETPAPMDTSVSTETSDTPETKPPEEATVKEVKQKEQPVRSRKIPVKILTESDIASGQYTMFDIVMPLPGFDMEYPPNMIGYYKELLAKDDLKLTLKHKHRSYSLSGAYRHVVARPTNMEWQCVRYSNPYGDLLASDMDEILDRHIETIIPDGRYRALLLTLNLPPSCYATMALREIMKANTSGDYQASLNDYFKDYPEEVKEGEKRRLESEQEILNKRIREEKEIAMLL